MMMIVPLILKKKTFLFNFLIAVCFALQRLATQINDVPQSDCKFYTESGKIDTQEKLKLEEHEPDVVFPQLGHVWKNTEKLLKQSLTTSCSHSTSCFPELHLRFYNLI